MKQKLRGNRDLLILFTVALLTQATLLIDAAESLPLSEEDLPLSDPFEYPTVPFEYPTVPFEYPTEPKPPICPEYLLYSQYLYTRVSSDYFVDFSGELYIAECFLDYGLDEVYSVPPIIDEVYSVPPITIEFIQVNRELTIFEVLEIKQYVIEVILNEFSQRFGDKFKIVEKTSTFLRVKVDLRRQLTNNNWEMLELTVVPTLESASSISILVDATLFVSSGFIPPTDETSYSIGRDGETSDYVTEIVHSIEEEVRLPLELRSLSMSSL